MQGEEEKGRRARSPWSVPLAESFCPTFLEALLGQSVHPEQVQVPSLQVQVEVTPEQDADAVWRTGKKAGEFGSGKGGDDKDGGLRTDIQVIALVK